MSIIAFVLKYWKYIAIAGALVAVIWWHSNKVDEAYDKGVSVTKERWRAQSLAEAEEAHKAVKAVQDALDQERRDNKKKREEAEQAERENQQRRAEEREKLIHEWQSRYRAALANNQECAAWSRLPVACPVR